MKDDEKTPWMKIATDEIGVKEKPGAGDNPRVLEYHAATTLHAHHDSVPWCAAFVSWCLETAGIPSTRNATALSYKHFGHTISEPVYGCIVVFAHKAKPGTGHVTFFHSTNADGSMRCLGGNQSDQVKYSDFKKTELVAYVMPKGF
jgi:uncharacterized protein (TIGR02594 family)